MWRGIKSISQRDCGASVPGRNQHRTVVAAVSGPEAVVFYSPRGPEGRWRVRRTGPPVRVRFGQRLDPISPSAGMRVFRGCLSATVSSTRHRHAYGPVHEDFTTELEHVSRTTGGAA